VSGRRDPDDELLEELREVIGKVDPPPTEVTEFAKAALGWRRLDAELAELLADSALETESASAVRSGDLARRLTFRTGDVSIDVEVRADGPVYRLLGQLAPPPAAATVEVQAGDGEIVASARCDSLGRFRLSLEVSGRIRIRVTRGDPPAVALETSWFSL
jgi:hypothetical protein